MCDTGCISYSYLSIENIYADAVNCGVLIYSGNSLIFYNIYSGANDFSVAIGLL